MQIHTLATGDLDDREVLGNYTTRAAAEAGLVEHALAGRVHGEVAIDLVEVAGDQVVIVATDETGDRLVAGPFDSWDDAERYDPDDEDLVFVEWTVGRYAQAVAAARPVTTEDLVAALRAHADTEPVPWGDGSARTRRLAAQLADAFAPGRVDDVQAAHVEH